MGAVRASAADSGSMAVLSTRVAIADGGTSRRNRGITSLSHMRCNSCGGPGSNRMICGRPSFSRCSHCPGARAARVGNHLGPGDDVGLARVVLGHRDASLGKALVHGRDQIVVAPEFDAQRGGNTLARQVVLGRAQPTHKDDEVGTLDRGSCDGGQLQQVIANDGLESDTYADSFSWPVR